VGGREDIPDIAQHFFVVAQKEREIFYEDYAAYVFDVKFCINIFRISIRRNGL
jgi:hypothetical protein